MKRYLFAASALLMSTFHFTSAYAIGCGVTAGTVDYKLNSPLVLIDPNAPTGSILWTRNIDTTGGKWLCTSGGQRALKSTIGGGFSTVVGTNTRGNIYSSGIEGLGIQISDLYMPNKAVPNTSQVSGNDAYSWSNGQYTRIDFIKVGPIGSGDLTNGKLATYTYDTNNLVVMTVSILGSRLKYKSCTIDGSYNRTIPLGTFKTTDINDTSPNVPFEMKLQCQADAVPVYVQFDTLNGSNNNNGLLAIDTTVAESASGVSVEILDANTMQPLKLGQETEYHTAQESSVSIPMIARYKKTGSVITPGHANAGMTISITEH
jgi:type 1 fimbria pilin